MPEKLTPLVYQSIIAYTKTGAPPEIAAGISGIGEKTFQEWMEMAAKGEDPYYQLKADIEAAEKEAFDKGFRSY